DAAASRTLSRRRRSDPPQPAYPSQASSNPPPPAPASAREFPRRRIREEDLAFRSDLSGAVSPPPAKRWGGVRGGGHRRGDRLGDHMHHTVNILHHVVVPEPQHAIPAVPHVGIAFRIARSIWSIAMLSAIQFDDQAF